MAAAAAPDGWALARLAMRKKGGAGGSGGDQTKIGFGARSAPTKKQASGKKAGGKGFGR